ncbi:MAG: glycosyltransferase family 4 protein [Candidatus Eiseniibacteriota bacterium]
MRAETKRVTVLLAESGTSVGGTERVLWELATRLPPARFDVRVWLSNAPGVDEFAAALERAAFPVERVAEVDSRWDFAGMLRTWAGLRRVAPRLLHVHHVWPAADRYLAEMAAAAGVPHLVITEHSLGASHSRAQQTLKRRELNRAGAVTAVCAAVAETLVRDYGADRARIRVVPNGAEPPDPAVETPEALAIRTRYGATPLKPLWVCAGRLDPPKGQDVLLQALARIREIGLPFTLLLAGEGANRGALEHQARELALADSVHFLGQVAAIGPLLLAADAVVLPSRLEGLPLTLLEALVRERPVIASAVGGIPEVITDGVHGRLVPAGDPAALAAALEAFHRHPDAARRLGLEGGRRVRDQFTWRRVAEQFEAVYDEVLGLASFATGASRVHAAAGRS